MGKFSTDCRTYDGITVGLIDSLITIARVLVNRDFSAPAVVEAMRDLSADGDFILIKKTADKISRNAIDAEENDPTRITNTPGGVSIPRR